jgi:hypothetical protein
LHATHFEEKSSPKTTQDPPGAWKRDSLPWTDAFWADDGGFRCHAGTIGEARFLGGEKERESLTRKFRRGIGFCFIEKKEQGGEMDFLSALFSTRKEILR